MLEDVIKTIEIKNKIISVLLYSIDKEERINNDNHKQFYEVRVSEKNDNSATRWYTDSEFYLKKDAIKAFKEVCKEIEERNLS